jgi:hypothetical protein
MQVPIRQEVARGYGLPCCFYHTFALLPIQVAFDNRLSTGFAKKPNKPRISLITRMGKKNSNFSSIRVISEIRGVSSANHVMHPEFLIFRAFSLAKRGSIS